MEEVKVDLTLVRTYQPAISLILGTLLLLFLHHGLHFMSLSERYTIIYSALYVKSETLPDSIFDSTCALAFIASNFLIQDIRIQNTKTDEALLMKISNPYVISIVFFAWTMLNGFAIVFIDKLFEINQSLHYNCKALLIPYTSHTESICYLHKSRFFSILLLVLNSACFLLVSNSSYQETRTMWEENFKIWTFVFFSLFWIFKVDYKNLTYTNVYSFHHCIVRFSSLILFSNFQAFLAAVCVLGCCVVYRIVTTISDKPNPLPKIQSMTQVCSGDQYDEEKLEELLKETVGQYSKKSMD
jgi:hypothetical protein